MGKYIPKGINPPKWNRDKHLKMAYQLALLGANDRQMAEVIGITISTLNYWKETKPEFMEALNKGKTPADSNVAYSLYKCATGFHYKEQVVLQNQVKEYDPETGKLVRSYTEPLIVEVQKYFPPQHQAAFKWLTIRQRKLGWSDTQKIEIQENLNITQTFDFSGYSEKELRLIEELGREQLLKQTANTLRDNVQQN